MSMILWFPLFGNGVIEDDPQSMLTYMYATRSTVQLCHTGWHGLSKHIFLLLIPLYWVIGWISTNWTSPQSQFWSVYEPKTRGYIKCVWATGRCFLSISENTIIAVCNTRWIEKNVAWNHSIFHFQRNFIQLMVDDCTKQCDVDSLTFKETHLPS